MRPRQLGAFPRAVVLLLGLLTCVAGAGGCIARAGSVPQGSEPIGPLFAGHRVTVAFTPRPATLVGIDLRVATYARHNGGVVTLQLKSAADARQALRTVRIPAVDFADSQVFRFAFDALDLANSGDGQSTPGKLVLEITSDAPDDKDAVAVWGRSPDGPATTSYDGVPLDVDLAFAPVYADPILGLAAMEIGALVASGVQVLVVALVLVVPGLLMARAVLGSRARPFALLCAAPALSVAGVAIVTLWCSTLGLRLGAPTAILVAILSCVGLALMVARPLLRNRGGRSLARLASIGDISVAGIVLLGALARAIAFDGFVLPPGADAYHHAIIAQLIHDVGALPTSYRPYAAIDSFAYHFGFHALVAWDSWLTGLPVLASMTATAFILNVLIALSVAFCAEWLGLGPMGRITAVLVVALLSPFPADLLDLARYPQTAGLVILPVAGALAITQGAGLPSDRVSGTGHRWSLSEVRPAVGLGVLAAGVFLTHYRLAIALVMLGILALGSVVGAAVRSRASEIAWRSARARFLGSIIAASVGLVLVAPWLVRLATTFRLGLGDGQGRYGPEYFSLERLGTALEHPLFWPLMALAVGGFVASVHGRRGAITLVGAWAGLTTALSNPYWLPIPRAGALDSVTLFSSLFLPVSIGIGFGAERMWARLPRAHARLIRPLAVATAASALVGLSLWGVATMAASVSPDGRIADSGDLDAARWIERSLPPDAMLLVNSAIRRWSPDYVVPTDAGYWMPLLAHRATTLLPLVYPGERGVTRAQVELMERISRASAARLGDTDTLALLRKAGVTHVYLGSRGGPLSDQALKESPAFRRIYQREGVSIYELSGSLARAPSDGREVAGP